MIAKRKLIKEELGYGVFTGPPEEEEVAVVEEKPKVTEPVDEEKLPGVWYINIWKQLEPIAKDVHVGSARYSEKDQEIVVAQIHDNNYASDVNTFIHSLGIKTESNGEVFVVDPNTDLDHWVHNVHLIGNVIADYYAKEAVFAHYED